ncbi:MAG: alkaline phosphatase family protein [Acidobacteria bacterium]|nr:alkaline phosphatase family protein [Acidobacteriota bacterium]
MAADERFSVREKPPRERSRMRNHHVAGTVAGFHPASQVVPMPVDALEQYVYLTPFRFQSHRRVLMAVLAFALLACSAGLHGQGPTAAPRRPKLVLLVAIDQFRYDYLPRFRGEYTGGLKRLLDHGASFVNANLQHYPTVTAVGHSTMLTGATPALSGIIGNDWFDRASGKPVTSVSDDTVKPLGGEKAGGASPRRLLVSTIGDELKRSGSPASKVFGLSMKDRSAILPAGHMANGAYWFDDLTGHFVSSTFYFPELPGWVGKFNARRESDKFAGKVWLAAKGGQKERRIPGEPGWKLNAAVYNSPFGNDLLELFAEQTIDAERLGTRGVTDLLSVSFSSNDAVGHAFGPDSPEAHAVSIGVDRSIGKLFAFIDQKVGLKDVLVILTADHAVCPVPELLESQQMPGGRLKGDFAAPIQQALEARFGPGRWLNSTAGSSPYLNYKLIQEKKLDIDDVVRVAAVAIATAPHVVRVYPRQQLLTSRGAIDIIDSRVMRSFHGPRSGDMEILVEPYWIHGSSGTTHGSPYNYDTHIPLVFMGPGIRPGRYYRAAALNDLAPTVAAMLDIEIPSGSVGRVLDEAIDAAALAQRP